MNHRVPGLACGARDGTLLSWKGERVFCNPPYSNITPFLAKAREADLAVFLLPVKSDLSWWRDYVMQSDEVRLIRGRLRFEAMSGGAPFPSAVAIYDERGGREPASWRTMERPPRSRELAESQPEQTNPRREP